MNSLKTKPTWTYVHGGSLYINITNRCPTSCVFCVKRAWGMRFEGHDLGLLYEPSVQEVLEAVGEACYFQEFVFCGFGDATYRLWELLEIAESLRRRPGAIPRIRLNTVGLGSLIHGRDIVPELAGRLDAVSVSLNTADPAQWVKLHQPLTEYRERGFESVLRFIRHSAHLLPETTVTAVDLPSVDLERCEVLAGSLGAAFRVRSRLS